MPAGLALSMLQLEEHAATARTVRQIVQTTPAELDETGALVDLRLVPCADVRQAELLRSADALVRLWPEYLAMRALVLGDVPLPTTVPAPRPFLRPMGVTPQITTPAAPAAEV
jgi:hypothetical protein